MTAFPSITAQAPTSDRARAKSRLRVLHSVAPPDGTTKYADHMRGSAPASVEPLFFTWRTALTGGYDVFHVHWPELLLREGWLRPLLVRMLLARLRWSRTPVVRTLHNIEPHESEGREARALARFDAATTVFIRMNPATPVEADWVVADIPHGDYRTAFAHLPTADRVPGRLAYVGLIRPYKNVEGLLDAFAQLDDPQLTLSVSGNPSRALREPIQERAARDPRVSLALSFVPDAELVRAVTSAELVVLPYREMHNSGILLVALSLGRPALVPASPSNQALSDEVGDGWVLQYEGEPTAAVLEWGLAQAKRAATLPPPRLEGRSWDAVGALHESAYREALRLVR